MRNEKKKEKEIKDLTFVPCIIEQPEKRYQSNSNTLSVETCSFFCANVNHSYEYSIYNLLESDA